MGDGPVAADVLVEVVGSIAKVIFNRPDLGNAVTPTQAEQLLAALRTFAADPAIRVVVVTGSGSSFNVGAGRSPSRADAPAASPSDVITSYTAQIPVMLDVVEILHSSSMVSIAAINGGCAGAGLALALACDLRYAAASARFNTAFLQVGLPGELGAIWHATRLIGSARARELFLLPGKCTAARFEELGLLTAVWEQEELLPGVLGVANRLAQAPPTVLAAMKANLVLAATSTLADYLPYELEAMTRAVAERAAARPSTLSTAPSERTTA